MQAYWGNRVAGSVRACPGTYRLGLIGLQVAGLVAASHKLDYMRARPGQVWPSIAPVIATPPHPSYPSGHGLQGLLIAECLKLVAPAMANAIDRLGERIGVNREIAGVHFPSDTAASKSITPKVMAVLKKVPQFDEVLQAAKAEWPASVRSVVIPK